MKEDLKEKLKSNGLATIPITMSNLKTNQVQSIFDLYKPQIAQALPNNITPERVIQLATTLVSRNPPLAECSTESLIGALIQCSQFGFEPIPSLGLCYLVPFNNKNTGKKEVNFLIGYQGLIELARRSKEIKTLYAEAVFENDFFEYELGLEPVLKHKPSLENRGNLKYVYAVCHFTNGGYAFKVMSVFDVLQVRKRSQSGASKYSPWETDFEAMALKTVIRRLMKYIPKSIEIQKHIVTDESIIRTDSFDKGELDINKIEHVEYTEELNLEVKDGMETNKA